MNNFQTQTNITNMNLPQEQIEQQKYINDLKNYNDRELLELQTYYASKTMNYSKSTNSFVVVIYLLFIVAFVCAMLVLLWIVISTMIMSDF